MHHEQSLTGCLRPVFGYPPPFFTRVAFSPFCDLRKSVRCLRISLQTHNYTMPITCGSIGDIISISLLLKDLITALHKTRGSSTEYQNLTRELLALDTALLQVAELLRKHISTSQVQSLYDKAKGAVEDCRQTVNTFSLKVRKYGPGLASGGSGNIFKDTACKIQWRASQKEEEIAKFRAEVATYTNVINMFLATAHT